MYLALSGRHRAPGPRCPACSPPGTAAAPSSPRRRRRRSSATTALRGGEGGGAEVSLTLVPDVSAAPAGGPVTPAHPALVQARPGPQLEVAAHLLALPGQAERQPALPTPGAILHPVQEAVEQAALLSLRPTVEAAGRLGQLGAPPQVVLPLQGAVVVEGALLVPPGAGVGGAGQEAARSPGHLAALAAGQGGEAEAAPGLEALAARPGAGRPGGPDAPPGGRGGGQGGRQED